MRAGVAAIVLLAVSLAGCGDLLEEHICAGGEHPVRPVDGGLGGQCVKDGVRPPDGFQAYPPGQVPEVIGDKWDTYWNDKATKVTHDREVKEALASLAPVDAPRGWKRTTIGDVGSLAAPADWVVDVQGATTRLSSDKAYVEVTLEPGAADAIDVRAEEIREAGTDNTDPVFDIDTLATWPGGTDARYLRTSRGVRGAEGFTSTEALLVVDESATLIVVRGHVEDAEIANGSVPSQILRTLQLKGA